MMLSWLQLSQVNILAGGFFGPDLAENAIPRLCTWVHAVCVPRYSV